MCVNYMNLIFSFIHSIYIIYVLRFFKTKYSLAHPVTYFDDKLLHHPIGKSEESRSPVCKLGHILSWYLALFVLLRGIVLNKYKKCRDVSKNISLVILCLTITLSFLNFNVIVLLLPHFFIEYFMYIN